ncbi:class I SAM-dependent methyltransferase [Actinomycetospora sp. NBRC 106378]|uniref:class I SAM-dependent methyltransferase n=1 Tax=Actinomycetospora sp. NBRC 106378 TaxID=3032208 RepID=UPI0024A05B4D|nr:class I SAM-dependent methyltransferase [Actinomycetospora sp. NBRC 106378]GLZ51767.1 hypothetical protein Acsp07_13840 [Actinomycetospora sp. NBRC 106378]
MTLLEQLPDQASEVALITGWIESARPDAGPVRILEAGCGNHWPLAVPDAHLTGLDLDADALRIRREELGDLDEAVVGDLVDADLPDGGFDVAYCAYVLEHVPAADRVLGNLLRWVRPGGLVVVKVPDPHSVRGAVTRVTPHWFHVAYWRYVVRYPHAGEPGYSPYPTFYHPVISRAGLRRFAAETGAEIVAERGDSRYNGDAPGLLGRAIGRFVSAVATASRGRLTATHDNLLVILRRP